MNIRTIFQALKILIGVTEQVVTLIADTEVPEAQQPEMNKEVDAAVETLQRAKNLIPIPPTDISN